MDFEGGGGYDPRALLPTETWSQILENLEDHPDPRDLTDASESCTLFSDILCDKVNPSRLAEVIPLVLQWLGRRDRLNCRCISKQITKSVDYILDNVERVEPNQHLNLYQNRFMPPRIPPSFEADHFGSLVNSVAVYWDNQVQVERFHREMTTSDLAGLAGRRHHHPMVGCSLNLRPHVQRTGDPRRNLVDWKICLERSLQLLPDYKNAVRHLTLDTIRLDLTGNLIETYDIRRRILTALPNLYCFFHLQWEDGGARVAEDVVNLERHIAQNPLPAMRYLEDVSLLNFWNPVPMPLVQEICARYGRQLKRLGTTQPADAQQSGDTQALFTLPDLTHLRIANCAHVDRVRNPPVILLNVQAENLLDLNLGTIFSSID